MTDRHPDREILERFLDGDLAEDACRALQRHLFLCPACEERLVDLLPAPDPPASSELREYRDLIRRLIDGQRGRISSRRGALSADRTIAAVLWRELAPHEGGSRRSLVLGDARFQSWGFFELLVDRSFETLLENPREAEDLARLALEVADRLQPSEHGAGSLEAAKARAWIHLGNALRVREDFGAAEAAFQTAERYFSESWLDPLDEALLLELKAPLRRAQRCFGEALEMLDAAIAIYREINEPNLQGRALMIKGVTYQYQGDLEQAADCLRASLSLVEEPRLVVLCRFNLIGCLQDAGRSREAAALIPEARRRLQEVGKRTDLLRLRWTEGKIAASTGRQAEAEQAFVEVRSALLQNAHAFDAALISLDLAALYLRQRRTEETKRLAAAVLPVFRSREVYREALAALIVFQRAAEMEQLTLGLVEEIAAYLERARKDPHLRFRDDE